MTEPDTPKRWVSRAGEKLDHALRIFDLDVTGRRCADFGCSTGGFTDCLLQHGATEVIASVYPAGDDGRGSFARTNDLLKSLL